jgi:hypothetical protein
VYKTDEPVCLVAIFSKLEPGDLVAGMTEHRCVCGALLAGGKLLGLGTVL